MFNSFVKLRKNMLVFVALGLFGLVDNLNAQSGVSFERCSSSNQVKLLDAYSYLTERLDGRSRILYASCLERAGIVEARGKKASEITRDLQSSTITRIRCRELPANVLGQARVSISGERLTIANSLAARGSPASIAATIIHEIAHNRGYRHTVNLAGSTYYANTVPEQAEACMRNANLQPNPWSGSGSTGDIAGEIVGIANSHNRTCYFLRDQKVICGNSKSMGKYTHAKYSLPRGYTPRDIVGIGNNANLVCAFYRDGMASCGNSLNRRNNSFNSVNNEFSGQLVNLASIRQPYNFGNNLPSGIRPQDISGVCGAKDRDRWYFWYKNETASGGASNRPTSGVGPYPVEMPSSRSMSDVIDMSCGRSTNCTWYKKGDVSCGTTDDLDRSRSLYSFRW